MEVTPQVQNHLTANMNISKKDIVIGNFLGGLAWGVGSVIGAGIIVAIAGIALNALGVFNVIGNALAPLNELKNIPQIPNFK